LRASPPLAGIAPLATSAFSARLWLVELAHDRAHERFECLSTEEWERARRFVFDRDRRRYCAARSALRLLLGTELGVSPETLKFSLGEHGKPRIEATPCCEFNVSHSGELALIGFAQAGDEIGVDIEVLRVMSNSEALAERHYVGSELAAVLAASGPERDLAFLRVWTRKEACMKAVGSGLYIAPETFEAGAERGLRVASLTPPARAAVEVEVESLEIGRSAVAAVARVRTKVESAKPM
jgi:4'-phosphopantetheinyl transferase